MVSKLSENLIKNETKKEKFIRLAESRTNKAVDAIRNIASLANPNNYDYSEADIRKILSALKEETNDVQRAFSSREKKRFKL